MRGCVTGRANIILDIGKTHSKLTLWDENAALVAREMRANASIGEALDTDGLELWLAETLSVFAKQAHVSAIMTVGHGATAAIIKDGRLACPVRDYETAIPDNVRAAYNGLRDPFTKTGSPALPMGLNLGAQLYAQRSFLAGSTVLLWPQYWSLRLSGVASSEVTSLGCHTDLWNPIAAKPSQLCERIGAKFPPLRRAGDVLGDIKPEWADRTGLPKDTKIHCGIHDSNAALIAARGFPEIAEREATILSTGTWFIAMRSAKVAIDLTALPEARDCLVNVDAFGQPVPSARFMGGREIALLGTRIDEDADQDAIIAALPTAIAQGAMIMPGFAPGCGPFPNNEGRWINPSDGQFERAAVIALYAALVTNTLLNLIETTETLLVEGRFAGATSFVHILATLRPDLAVFTSAAEADVSFGALRLIDPSLKPSSQLTRAAPLEINLTDYVVKWHDAVNKGRNL